MSEHKLSGKFGEKAKTGLQQFLWWIDKNNEREAIRRPPCYLFIGENRAWRKRLRALFIHYAYCRPKKWRPHRAGCWVDDRYLEDYKIENLRPEFERTFGSSPPPQS